MNRLRRLRLFESSPRLTAALAACVLLCATHAAGQRAELRGSVAARARAAGKSASHAGVSFTYDASLASDVKAEVARPEGCGKPGDVLPTHVAFTLAGYPKPHESPFMQPPEIRVFPVAEYRRALAACEKEMAATIIGSSPPLSYVSDFDDEVRTLKALSAARPGPRALGAWLRKKSRGREYLRGRMPLVPMYDVGEALRAKVSYVDFRGGSGVAFVTQYTIEDTLVSNQALAYVFQGLTRDGQYYVSAAFPVAAPFLPSDYTEREAARLGLNQAVLSDTKLERRYKNYLARTARRLEALPPGDYRPGLGLLNDLLRSLDVNPAALKTHVNPN